MDHRKALRSCLLMAAVFAFMYFRFNGPRHYWIVIIGSLILALVLIVIMARQKKHGGSADNVEDDIIESATGMNNDREKLSGDRKGDVE